MNAAATVRRVYRRVASLLPANAQVSVTHAIVVGRRFLRARLRRSVVDVPGGRTTMLVALGRSEDDVPSALADAAARRSRGEAVLLVTDCDAFSLYRQEQLPFEYMPPPRELAKAGLDPDVWMRTRLAHLVDVYRPNTVVTLDPPV